jgi:hypothetical protein
MLAEARALFEFNASLLLSPLLMRAPRGDGHPVLALPGFPRQRPVDGADAALSETARLRHLRLEDGPQSRRRSRKRATRCAIC